MSKTSMIFIAATCIIALVSPSTALSHSRRLLQDSGRTPFLLANSTLDQAKAVVAALSGSGEGNLTSLSGSAYQASYRSSLLADDLVDDDNLQNVATANALSGAAGVAAASAAAGYSANASRLPELNQGIAEVELLLSAIDATPTTGGVSRRVEEAADAAASASVAAVAAFNAVEKGDLETIGNAFDEAGAASDDAEEASEAGAGSAAIRASETVAHVILAAGYRYQNNTAAAWISAVDGGLSAQRAASAAAATTDSDGGCDGGEISTQAELAADIIGDDQFENGYNDDLSQRIEQAIVAAVPLVTAARSACPIEGGTAPAVAPSPSSA